MDIALVVIGLVAAGGVGFYFWRRSQTPKEEPVYYYHCDCKRKLRYLARQANQKGMCPVCRRQFTFPAIVTAGKRR